MLSFKKLIKIQICWLFLIMKVFDLGPFREKLGIEEEADKFFLRSVTLSF